MLPACSWEASSRQAGRPPRRRLPPAAWRCPPWRSAGRPCHAAPAGHAGRIAAHLRRGKGGIRRNGCCQRAACANTIPARHSGATALWHQLHIQGATEPGLWMQQQVGHVPRSSSWPATCCGGRNSSTDWHPPGTSSFRWSYAWSRLALVGTQPRALVISHTWVSTAMSSRCSRNAGDAKGLCRERCLPCRGMCFWQPTSGSCLSVPRVRRLSTACPHSACRCHAELPGGGCASVPLNPSPTSRAKSSTQEAVFLPTPLNLPSSALTWQHREVHSGLAWRLQSCSAALDPQHLHAASALQAPASPPCQGIGRQAGRRTQAAGR